MIPFKAIYPSPQALEPNDSYLTFDSPAITSPLVELL
jgi:hypothetical protein